MFGLYIFCQMSGTKKGVGKGVKALKCMNLGNKGMNLGNKKSWQLCYAQAT